MDKLKARERVELAAGWAEWDRDAFVQVGDRAIPERIDVTLPSTPDGWPSLHMTIEVRRGAPQCTELTIKANPDGREVRGVDLRAVDLESWVEEVAALASMDVVLAPDGTPTFRKSGNRVLRGLTEPGEVVDTTLADLVRMFGDEGGESELLSATRTIRRVRSRARRKVDDELLQMVAKVYREHLTDRPVVAVAATFGTTHRTAARYVQTAREQGFLPKTSRGRVAG